MSRVIRERCASCVLGLAECPCTPRECELVNPAHPDFRPAIRALKTGEALPRRNVARAPNALPEAALEAPADEFTALRAAETCPHRSACGCGKRRHRCAMGNREVTLYQCLTCQSAPNL